jgi:hypothetical protein
MVWGSISGRCRSFSCPSKCAHNLDPSILLFGGWWEFFHQEWSSCGMTNTHQYLVLKLRVSGAILPHCPACIYGTDRSNLTTWLTTRWGERTSYGVSNTNICVRVMWYCRWSGAHVLWWVSNCRGDSIWLPCHCSCIGSFKLRSKSTVSFNPDVLCSWKLHLNSQLMAFCAGTRKCLLVVLD